MRGGQRSRCHGNRQTAAGCCRSAEPRRGRRYLAPWDTQSLHTKPTEYKSDLLMMYKVTMQLFLKKYITGAEEYIITCNPYTKGLVKNTTFRVYQQKDAVSFAKFQIPPFTFPQIDKKLRIKEDTGFFIEINTFKNITLSSDNLVSRTKVQKKFIQILMALSTTHS